MSSSLPDSEFLGETTTSYSYLDPECSDWTWHNNVMIDKEISYFPILFVKMG